MDISKHMEKKKNCEWISIDPRFEFNILLYLQNTFYGLVWSSPFIWPND